MFLYITFVQWGNFFLIRGDEQVHYNPKPFTHVHSLCRSPMPEYDARFLPGCRAHGQWKASECVIAAQVYFDVLVLGECVIAFQAEWQGLGLKVQGLGSKFKCLGCRLLGSGSRICWV